MSFKAWSRQDIGNGVSDLDHHSFSIDGNGKEDWDRRFNMGRTERAKMTATDALMASPMRNGITPTEES
jgi:hypothetical protein